MLQQFGCNQHLDILNSPLSLTQLISFQLTKSVAESPPYYLEVLQKAKPCSVPPELLLRHLPTTKPRKYSISTAPLYENRPDLHVTFKEIVYARNGKSEEIDSKKIVI